MYWVLRGNKMLDPYLPGVRICMQRTESTGVLSTCGTGMQNEGLEG